MNQVLARKVRWAAGFIARARRSGERVCGRTHHNLMSGQACPGCKAVV